MGNQETLTLLGTEVTGQRQRCNQELKKTFASCENKSGIAPF
jgi:hypothetical protein